VCAFGERSATGSEHDGVDHQEILVDQVGDHERPDQLATSHDCEIAGRTALELRDRFGGVAVEQDRVRPRQRPGERARGDVFGGRVDPVRVGVIGLTWPVCVEVLVGLAAQQQRLASLAVPSAIFAAITSSLPATAHPPCSNPPSVSSHGRPGACITPSSVT